MWLGRRRAASLSLEDKPLHIAWCHENVGFDQIAPLNTVQNFVALSPSAHAIKTNPWATSRTSKPSGQVHPRGTWINSRDSSSLSVVVVRLTGLRDGASDAWRCFGDGVSGSRPSVSGAFRLVPLILEPGDEAIMFPEVRRPSSIGQMVTPRCRAKILVCEATLKIQFMDWVSHIWRPSSYTSSMWISCGLIPSAWSKSEDTAMLYIGHVGIDWSQYMVGSPPS